MPPLSVTGICKITRDGELFKAKNSSGGWLRFSAAAFRKYVKEGKQDSDIFEIEHWMKNASSGLDKSVKKGRLIYLDKAELRNEKFVGKDGKDKNFWKIAAYSFDFIDAAPQKEDIPKEENKGILKDDDGEEIPF